MEQTELDEVVAALQMIKRRADEAIDAARGSDARLVAERLVLIEANVRYVRKRLNAEVKS